VAAALGCVVVEMAPGLARHVALSHRVGQLTPSAERFIALAEAAARAFRASRVATQREASEPGEAPPLL
jgi:molybdopterin synthase catalytic subunit